MRNLLQNLAVIISMSLWRVRGHIVTLIFRALKGLQTHIDVTIVCPDMLSHGWQFGIPEPLYGYTQLHQLYTHAKADYTGRVTVLCCGIKTSHDCEQ